MVVVKTSRRRNRFAEADHAVGSKVLVLCLEVDSVLVVLTNFCHAVHEEFFTVSDPL